MGNTTLAPERAAELKRMKKARGLHFTLAGAQRAMDAKAGKWGYPPGYYRVTAKTGKRYQLVAGVLGRVSAQDYVVQVVLFGGQRRVDFPVCFILDHHGVQYHQPLAQDSPLGVTA